MVLLAVVKRCWVTADARWQSVDVLAAAVLASGAVMIAARESKAVPLLVFLGLAITLPVAWRRRAPFSALATTAVAALAYSTMASPGLPMSIPAGVPVLLVLYTLGSSSGWQWSVVGLAASTVATCAAIVIAHEPLTYLETNVPTMGAAWLLGLNSRIRRAQLSQLRQLNRQLAADQQRSAELAAAAERARIARELHDVVTHNVTVMVIGAGATRVTAGADAGRLRNELASIEKIGRQTLGELRRLLGVLRAGDELAEPREPQPGMADLDELLDHVRDAGLPVELCVRGQQIPLPQGISVSAFRILQEALSNTLRHAGPCDARVVISFSAAELGLLVEDTGRGPVGDHAGHGLVGMRERVAMVGGELRTEARPDGGFRVLARLPLGQS